MRYINVHHLIVFQLSLAGVVEALYFGLVPDLSPDMTP